MATYALTFATRAAFDTSLASGDIYNLMQGVTSSKPSVAITATITESGETFACGTNVMVDIKSVGPGDYVMYDSTNNKFFGIASKWIDNNYPAQPTQHIMIFKAGVLPARYVVCGTVVKRFGNRIRLAGEPEALPWTTTGASYNWEVPGLAYYTYTTKKSRANQTEVLSNNIVSYPSSRRHEAAYPNGNTSWLPITRAAWNAAVNSGATTVTGGGKTITLANYDNNYDRFLDLNYSPLWPAVNGSFSDKDGIGHTKLIVDEFVANHGKTSGSVDYAAGYCYNYAVNAPGLGKYQWYLGVIKDIGEIAGIMHTLLIPLSWSVAYLSSCSQNALASALYIDPNSATYGYTKNTQAFSVPLADLILEN